MNAYYEKGAAAALAHYLGKTASETREKAEARVPAKPAVPAVPAVARVGWKEQKTPPAKLSK